jgi:hypothetical protein
MTTQSDMKTYTDRSNCIRAARKLLGPTARPDHDFYLLGGNTAWQWQTREAGKHSPALRTPAQRREDSGLPPILERKNSAKRAAEYEQAAEHEKGAAAKAWDAEVADLVKPKAKREALQSVLKAEPPQTSSRANPVKARAALKAKPPKGRAAPTSAPKIAQNGSAPKLGKRAAIEAAAQAGKLPPPPDLTAMTHKRWRGNLDDLVQLVKEKNVKALKRYVVKPGGSSHRAVDRYRRLSIIALEAKAAR